MILDRFRLDGKVAIVTGAGRGIGAGIAVAFAEAGADVAVGARTMPEVEAVAARIRALGRRAIALPCDVMERAQLEAFVEQSLKQLRPHRPRRQQRGRRAVDAVPEDE